MERESLWAAAAAWGGAPPPPPDEGGGATSAGELAPHPMVYFSNRGMDLLYQLGIVYLLFECNRRPALLPTRDDTWLGLKVDLNRRAKTLVLCVLSRVAVKSDPKV